MAADDHLSPTQFGFKNVTHDEWYSAMQGQSDFDLPYDGGTPGRIDPSTELYTGQTRLSPEALEHYRGRKTTRSDHAIEIYHYDGKKYLGDGHHRMAVARERGQKSARVIHFGKGFDG